MKPKKIRDDWGDALVVEIYYKEIDVTHERRSDVDFLRYTPAESKRLRKALKRAEREIKARA